MEKVSSSSSGGTPPAASAWSLLAGESPAMFPNAQIACSRTCARGAVLSRRMKAGMAPASRTADVCSEDPEAMLVRAHPASSCNTGSPSSPKKPTSVGTQPASTTTWMGGSFSMLRNLRTCSTADRRVSGSLESMSFSSPGSSASFSASRLLIAMLFPSPGEETMASSTSRATFSLICRGIPSTWPETPSLPSFEGVDWPSCWLNAFRSSSGRTASSSETAWLSTGTEPPAPIVQKLFAW
mmetsp:Transcript_42248/g.95555  ORF Transcript_42248/g.95555 Transcript_42248/m.95555 type:complete len:240 (+) Transcript_42248:336-1055(+)